MSESLTKSGKFKKHDRPHLHLQKYNDEHIKIVK